MTVDFDTNVHPFFQAMIKKVDKPVKAADFYKKLKEAIAEKNKSSPRQHMEIIQPKPAAINEDHFLAILVKHTLVATWYWDSTPVNLTLSKTGIPLDIEYDLVVFYYKSNFVFVYSNCQQMLSVAGNAQEEIFQSGGARFKKLSGEQIDLILSQFKIEYRSLGIQNHFGLGGTAPEGKTYHGKDTSASLTPSFDAGYGFSYCIAAIIPSTGKPEPFGCSKNKSKIWTTWVKDLNAFCDECDKIIKWLNNKPGKNNQLDVLVKPVSKTIIGSLAIAEFFLDYYILEKGMVFLGGTDLSAEWYCYYDTARKLIHFSAFLDGGVLEETTIDVNYHSSQEVYQFSYSTGQVPFEIAIHEPSVQHTGRNTIDLADFLNEQENFTILYDKPYAYRGEDCWEDTRLNRTFKHSSSEIDWKKVDIKKENLPAVAGKFNILQAITQHFSKDPLVIVSCNDNGANEIADYLVIYENRFILIHAKYAAKPVPSLVIDDIQVVASQTVKNIRFFNPAAYTDAIIQRLFKNITGKTKVKKDVQLKTKLLSVLQDKDTVKECWIVQPGISLPKLKKDPTNKMHTILNFVHSVLVVNGIQFKLVANSK